MRSPERIGSERVANPAPTKHANPAAAVVAAVVAPAVVPAAANMGSTSIYAVTAPTKPAATTIPPVP